MRARVPRCLLAALLAVGLSVAVSALQPRSSVVSSPVDATLPAAEELASLRAYVKSTWAVLTRTLADLPAAARDPKLRRTPPWTVYVAPTDDVARVREAVDRALDDEGRRQVDIRLLPADRLGLREHGLLFLPRPYVVPGGRFNEMYGWDSYFILLGLVRDGELDRARDLVDNFVYEITHYGTILNANRTYYLSRSQPPFLTRMVLRVFEQTHDLGWLREVFPAVRKHYDFWVGDPHLLAETGLSRYYDLGEGPAPEVMSDERDGQGRTHYDRVREYYRTTAVDAYDLRLYYDREADTLTPLFYKGDRSMRESGFDPSNRFGPFSVDILHYAPVCLNSLLYQMERDAAEIARLLALPDEALFWDDRARIRRERVDRFLWDEPTGLYADYHVQSRSRRAYPFATTFYPLWSGMASAEQARRVRAQLTAFEAPGGILTSTTVSGSQWDAPFGWAPLQLIASEGLRRYGYVEDADRLARRFVALVAKEFEEHGVIVEKYDVVRRESDVSGKIRFGYGSNEVGFGWTNGVLLELLARLGAVRDRRLAHLDGARTPRATSSTSAWPSAITSRATLGTR